MSGVTRRFGEQSARAISGGLDALARQGAPPRTACFAFPTHVRVFVGGLAPPDFGGVEQAGKASCCMPAGVPVATVSIGGARNAGLLAVRILSVADEALRERMVAFQASLADTARAKNASLQERLGE